MATSTYPKSGLLAGPPLRALNAQITDAHTTLGGLRSGWLIGPIAYRLHAFDTLLSSAGGM